MKQSNNIMILLFCAAALAGCSADNEVDNEIRPPIQQEWKAVAQATADSVVEIDGVEDEDVNSRRALFYGGNGRRFYTLWDQGDVVTVYKNNVSVGTMVPETYGTMSTTLTGTLTGPFAVNDELVVWRPSAELNYTGQTGTIYGLSQNYVYQRTTATVLQASDKVLTISDVNPIHQQEYLRFVLLNEAGTERLHPTRLELHAISGGHIVESVAADGTITPCDVLTVLPEEDNGEYPGELFVALINEGNTAVTYRIKAHVGEDIYVGPVAGIDGQNVMSRNSRSSRGSLTRILRKMRLTSSASALTISDIASRTFTGSPIVPGAAEVVVKDGETPLVQGTDYSYAFTNNTNVGEATLTITGLAMNGEKAQTKWLGEKTKTFIITKATPVVEISSTKMELTNHEGGTTSSTRVVARVFVDNNANGTWDAGTDYDITALCTVAYSSSNTGVCTVNATTGQVTAVGPGTATITATVQAAANWNTAQTTYEVEVRGDVRGGNSVNPWGDGGTTDDDTHTGY